MHDSLFMILEQLKKSTADAWVLQSETKRSQELFFVRQKLDMNRLAETVDYTVTVYVDFVKNEEKMRGSAEAQLSPLETADEMEEKIASAVAQAKLVENKWYPLPTNRMEDIAAYQKKETVALHDDLMRNYAGVVDALLGQKHPLARVNSAEFFAVEGEMQVITSEGTDISYPLHTVEFELVTEAEGETEPVEVFTIYTLSTIDTEKIQKIARAQLEETAGRAVAQPTTVKKNQRVLITGDAVEEFFQMCIAQASARMVFHKQSRAKIGETLTPGKEAKTPLTIDMVPDLETSPYARPVDEEGKLLKPYRLYEQGQVKALVAQAQYGHYLNVPLTGRIRSFTVNPGSEAIADVRKNEHVEILKFSSFVADAMTGDFGGEFRLAREVDADGKGTYLTAGAISENLFDQLPRLLTTKEMTNGRFGQVPQAIILDGVTITGESRPE